MIGSGGELSGSFGQGLVLLVETERQRKTILITLIVTMGMTQTVYLNIPVFLPEYRFKHHPLINDIEVGIILA